MRHRSIILLLAMWPLMATAGLDIHSGTLLLRSGTIRSETVSTDAGARLVGNGRIEAAAITLDGITAPSGEYEAETGTLVFSGDVVLNGIYICKANAHTDVDLILASGAVSGGAAIQVHTNSGAIPLDQVIVSGAGGSDFAAISLVPAQVDLFQLSAHGSDLQLTDLLGDTNADGLPDWWQSLHFGGRTSGLPGTDSDGDLFANIDEYGAGTDPTNAASFFALVHARVDRGDSNTVLQWSSATGKTYVVEMATHLPNGDFELVVTNITATPPQNAWTNALGIGPVLFYRVAVERD